ncbi:MAG: OmpA family protein [Candidatus Omnitrophica bacterium]|nr:OmpA family protein [Candidatus Omnitrophota bacterium]MBU1047958.1 OmpA family protein [Candidatus Omnitrophota bacterium]MBU1630403.1 OmpA family protein [Candidatus Omnitrophota bacterium]MBU1767636.1 OmpA family protein [Candidatus Omnitrophota bacterium]MBU1889759.1 OmpA family protein [Candidatus Omnitrophota bacterium]
MKKNSFVGRVAFLLLIALSVILLANSSYAFDFNIDKRAPKEERKKQELEELQEQFQWWPTDAMPGPVQDQKRGGYWWWPTEPGETETELWGNRGYVYVYKMIFDYKEEELAPPQPKELRPSLLIKKIIRNVKIHFDFDKSDLREDAQVILKDAVRVLNRNLEASILITGNCDIRGQESYNEKLGRNRAESVKKFMLENGIAENRIKIVSRGKLDAIAPITDLVGMQKDRNAQFMIAEVQEVMLQYSGKPKGMQTEQIEEGKFLIETEEEIESEIKVSIREYVVQKGDTLSKIAQEQLGRASRWKYLYELNKDRIKDPNKLKVGQKIIIPIE